MNIRDLFKKKEVQKVIEKQRFEPKLLPKIRVTDVAEGFKREFEIAKNNHQFPKWGMNEPLLNNQLRDYGYIMRKRSRNLRYNSAIFKRAIKIIVENVIGENGFQLQVKGVEADLVTQDTKANNLIEEHFGYWGHKNVCDASKQMSFEQIQRVVLEHVLVDGEALVHLVRDKNINEYGFALQLLDPDRLPWRFNKDLGNGNCIRMGIEYNKYNAPVAYHIVKNPTSSIYNTDYNYSVNDFERIPAENIQHVFIKEFAEQGRGIPILHTVGLDIKILEQLEENTLIKIAVGAGNITYIKSEKENDDASTLADSKDASGEYNWDITPGIRVLPPGMEPVPVDNNYPEAVIDPFVKRILMKIAMGAGLQYHSLCSDLGGVSYSSAREAKLSQSDNFLVYQNWFKKDFVSPVFEQWFITSMTNGTIVYPSGKPLPISGMKRFMKYNFMGRRWGWVDPFKDIMAQKTAIELGLKSRRQVSAEMGLDLDQTWEQIEREIKEAEQIGLNLNLDQSVYAAAQQELLKDDPEQKETDENGKPLKE